MGAGCNGLCTFEDFKKEYNAVGALGQAYRREGYGNFKLLDNWKRCTICEVYYQGPRVCPCCKRISRTTAHQKKTRKQQAEYFKNHPELGLKIARGANGLKKDILANKEKLEMILALAKI